MALCLSDHSVQGKVLSGDISAIIALYNNAMSMRLITNQQDWKNGVVCEGVEVEGRVTRVC